MNKPVGPGPCPKCKGVTERYVNSIGKLYWVCSTGYASTGAAGHCGWRAWNNKNVSPEEVARRDS